MNLPAVRRGDIWFAHSPGGKVRLVLVLSRNPMGRILNSVICAPITSTVRDLATEVILGPEVGLEHDSAANFDNTFQLHRSGLVKFVGRASEEAMEQACNALAAAVGCNRR